MEYVIFHVLNNNSMGRMKDSFIETHYSELDIYDLEYFDYFYGDLNEDERDDLADCMEYVSLSDVEKHNIHSSF